MRIRSWISLGCVSVICTVMKFFTERLMRRMGLALRRLSRVTVLCVRALTLQLDVAILS